MKDPLLSVLLGTAVGDSLGLPAENLSPRQIHKRWPGNWSHRFFLGRGMVSDDTEHTVFVGQCLAGKTNVEHFRQELAWKLRWWLICIPVGIGFATLRSILKLWLGFPVSSSGVFSAGNGPAMRSALIGAYFSGNLDELRNYVRASTRLTHTDPKAEIAALAVALTAAWTIKETMIDSEKISDIRNHWNSAGCEDSLWLELVGKILTAYDKRITVELFAEELGLSKGVTGYAYHTVPVALYAWLLHFGNFRGGIESVLNCGGDTDTVGAISGSLLAINSDIPQEWITHLKDYPISTQYLCELASALNDGTGSKELPKFGWVVLPFRNLFFFAVVIAHVIRRLLPF